MNTYPINKLNIAKIFFLLFLASLFLPIRYIFPTSTAYQTGAYSDFTSISLYLSDIFLFITLLFIILPRGDRFKAIAKSLTHNTIYIILILWLIINLTSHYSSLTSLNWWFFVKYLELIVAYETSRYLFRETTIKDLFIKLFVAISSLESILALVQFIRQTSVGGLLHKIGENVLNPNILGLAKIVSGETSYIRGYGTFPHPNLLSAFLLVGTLFSVYLLISAKPIKTKVLYSFILFINLLGLTVTFSRAGFLGLGVGLIVFFCFQLLTEREKPKKELWRAIFVTGAAIFFCVFIFKPFLSTRATVSDSSSLERIFYAKLGVKMIKDHPIFGIGIGDSVLHMQQYSPLKLWPWQIQPIHNYFLLAAAELGIPGALILICAFLYHLEFLFKNSKLKIKNFKTPLLNITLFSILLSFLTLMMFDHYFYTLQQTQMLLWVMLGVIAAEKNPG